MTTGKSIQSGEGFDAARRGYRHYLTGSMNKKGCQ